MARLLTGLNTEGANVALVAGKSHVVVQIEGAEVGNPVVLYARAAQDLAWVAVGTWTAGAVEAVLAAPFFRATCSSAGPKCEVVTHV